jgi:hypothetical protein
VQPNATRLASPKGDIDIALGQTDHKDNMGRQIDNNNRAFSAIWWPLALLVVILAALVNACSAGTAAQQAAASVAVAHARLTIGNQQPALPDTTNRYGSAEGPTISQTWAQVEEELAATKAALEVSQRELDRIKAETIKPAAETPTAETINNATRATDRGPMRIDFAGGEIAASGPRSLPAQLIVRIHKHGACPPGERVKREIMAELPRLKWIIGETDDCQIKFEYSDPTAEPCPQITLLQRGRTTMRWNQYTDVGTLSNALRAAWDDAGDEPAPTHAAAGTGGTFHGAAQIRQCFEWIKAYIGEGIPIAITWGRTGQQVFPLIHKTDWSPLALLGTTGHVNVSTRGANKLPFDEFGLDYRLSGDTVFVRTDEIKLENILRRFSMGRPSAPAANTYGLFVIDDIVAYWTIFSAFRDIASLLWPTVDLSIPGEVGLTAVLTDDALEVVFQQPPTVKLTEIFTFTLDVQRVTVTPSNIHVEFSGSRWVKSRDFPVN